MPVMSVIIAQISALRISRDSALARIIFVRTHAIRKLCRVSRVFVKHLFSRSNEQRSLGHHLHIQGVVQDELYRMSSSYCQTHCTSWVQWRRSYNLTASHAPNLSGARNHPRIYLCIKQEKLLMPS